MTESTDIEKYVPKKLQTINTGATIPNHPELLFETSRLTKENEEFRTKITDLEARLQALSDNEAIIQYLETFKSHFEFHCVIEGHDVTIMRCVTILNLGFCNAKNVCRGRIDLGKKLKYL